MKTSDYKALSVEEKVLEVVRNFFREEKEGNHHARDHAKLSLQDYLVKTDDGSYTLNSDILDGKSETMHTRHGAVREAMEKFVKPAKLDGKDNVRVLDICSGLGYNTSTCIDYLSDDVEIELDLVEISKETLTLALLMYSSLESYRFIQKAVEDELYEMGDIKFRYYQDDIPDNIHINLYIEDARVVVKGLEGYKKYDAIFLDPFSPLKSPELYTNEFFMHLKNLLKDDGVILTYTSAAPVRAAIVKSGLHLGEGPSFGRSGGTVASLKEDVIDKPLSMDDERMIALSDAGIPFKDPEFNDSYQKILQRRDQERMLSRGRIRFSSTVKTPIYLNKELDDGRLKRRVLNNLKKLGFDDLKSPEARYVVCPQYRECVCGGNCRYFGNSRERIYEMNHRLRLIVRN
jgi:tRNA U34 5-methylaminomethyl-2-thiouridine-forming methyltransferase MnmC